MDVNNPLAGIANMKILSLLLLLNFGAAGHAPVPVRVGLIVGEVKHDTLPILSVRKLAISELRIVRRLKQIWRELNESSIKMDVQKILNT